MKNFSLTLGAALVLLGAIIIVRAATFTSRQIQASPAPPIQLDENAIVGRLAEAIKLKTVSFQSPADESAGEFQKFHQLLAKSFPLAHAGLAQETVNDYSLLFTWKGKNPELKPILLMAHLDVVSVDPASEPSWSQPPFAGRIADGFIWGRGAMDDKVSVMAIFEAVEYLLQNGFAPERTVYLAFGHDEEIGGKQGAAKIAELLALRKVELEFVLDEGMNILSGVIDGVTPPVALIGIAEKGYLSVQLSAKSAGGHSSIPPTATAIGAISRALQRLDGAPFPARFHGPTRQMFEFLGAEMAWSKKLALANLWLFEPLVKQRLSRSPLTNAILRTTLAPTIFNAGVQENVLPAQASAVVNLRIMPGETTAGALEHVRKVIDDPRVELTPLPIRVEPSPVSDAGGAGFKLLQRTIREVAPETIAAPALLVGATDSRHYAALTKNIFRFLPITLTAQDAKRYHGIDERISLQDYRRCVRFYAQLINNADRP
jgi:carboxypeptidase PM20D1